MAISNTIEKGGRALSKNLDNRVIEEVNIDSTCQEARFYIPGYKKTREKQDLSNLVDFPTCFKSLDNTSTIDFVIANQKSSFQNTIGVSTGLSDFH